MPFENLVGINVTKPGIYELYRAAMTPILTRMGGSFRADFDVSRVLKNPGDKPVNRVFVIRFPDRAAHKAFFSNREYLKARAEFFERGVDAVTIIAEYDLPETK